MVFRWPIEIDGLPIEHGGSFHGFPAVPVLEPRGGACELIDPQHAPAPKATEAPEPARLGEQNDVQRGTPHLDHRSLVMSPCFTSPNHYLDLLFRGFQKIKNLHYRFPSHGGFPIGKIKNHLKQNPD